MDGGDGQKWRMVVVVTEFSVNLAMVMAKSKPRSVKPPPVT